MNGFLIFFACKSPEKLVKVKENCPFNLCLYLRLAKKPPMPYKVWEARLREWIRGWYVVLEKLDDPIKVYEKIGVPERFFGVLGTSFPLDRVQYHELTYYERVWIMKGLCDQLFVSILLTSSPVSFFFQFKKKLLVKEHLNGLKCLFSKVTFQTEQNGSRLLKTITAY